MLSSATSRGEYLAGCDNLRDPREVLPMHSAMPFPQGWGREEKKQCSVKTSCAIGEWGDDALNQRLKPQGPGKECKGTKRPGCGLWDNTCPSQREDDTHLELLAALGYQTLWFSKRSQNLNVYMYICSVLIFTYWSPIFLNTVQLWPSDLNNHSEYNLRVCYVLGSALQALYALYLILQEKY